MQDELSHVRELLNPRAPFLAVVGGGKYDTKIGPLNEIYKKVRRGKHAILLGLILLSAVWCTNGAASPCAPLGLRRWTLSSLEASCTMVRNHSSHVSCERGIIGRKNSVCDPPFGTICCGKSCHTCVILLFSFSSLSYVRPCPFGSFPVRKVRREDPRRLRFG